MKFQWHVAIAAVILAPIAYWIGMGWFDAALLIFLTTLPDIDTHARSNQHRSIFTHEALIPLLWAFNIWPTLVADEFRWLFVLSVSIHLLCDIKFRGKDGRRPGGTYGLKPSSLDLGDWKTTTAWLLIHGLAGVISTAIWVLQYKGMI